MSVCAFPVAAHAQSTDARLSVSASGSIHSPVLRVGVVNGTGVPPSANVRRLTIERPPGLKLAVPSLGTSLGRLSFKDERGYTQVRQLLVRRRQANHTDRYVLAEGGGASVVLRLDGPTVLRVVLPERSGSPGLHVHDPRLTFSGRGVRVFHFASCATVRIRARIEPTAAGRAFNSSANLSGSALRSIGACRG